MLGAVTATSNEGSEVKEAPSLLRNSLYTECCEFMISSIVKMWFLGKKMKNQITKISS